MKEFRQSTQEPAPARHEPGEPGRYDIYPSFPLGSGLIGLGFDALAGRIIASGHSTIIIDGFVGVLWDWFVSSLSAALARGGASARFHPAGEHLKRGEEIDLIIEPFLGGDDPLFGKRCTLPLSAFFSAPPSAPPPAGPELSIIYGTGAALSAQKGLLLYIDVPKSEVQFRSRKGSFTNLGARTPLAPKEMYKRMYFVDWPVLNRHRAALLPDIGVFVDAQRPGEPAFMTGEDFRAGLEKMAENYIRVRPWFEPGPWGGAWIKEHIPRIAPAPNYAWSFELISPENGIGLESGGITLEASFDFLMFRCRDRVLGRFAERFGYEFPIRYDFLDTFGGGNLSLQCHPRAEYIERHFGEPFTQDESYYILDCAPGSRVFLGFREGVNSREFRQELERGERDGTPVDVERYVNTVGARRHDLFLIPAGTIHCSGINNLVLEISSTPYIYTFKMYDWMRMDLDGTPRPLNIARAFENLAFERQGKRVEEELISREEVIAAGAGWRLVHLPTHPLHLYDVHRFEFSSSVEAATDGSCHVMNLVEGEWITLETAGGMRQRFNYAETFIVPAAAGRYRLVNGGRGTAKVVKTFLKTGARPFGRPEGAGAGAHGAGP
ncbi:MAG TPA: class I mannose-6-phosphate isomerase [Bacteroidota bacterium]|nr:class I mannose-6-phosphate isomerase [Bacteroidota bacterium]